jgi:ubiquitin-protein ligase
MNRSYRLGVAFKSPRSIRLGLELEELRAMKRNSTIFDFEAFGDPAEKYLITFKGNTLVPIQKGAMFPSEEGDQYGAAVGGPQQVEISLGGEYPRRQPNIRWLTPIIHPNIWGHGTVCLGNFAGQWTPYFRLVDLVEILWDMARLAILNPRSAGTGARNVSELWKRLDGTYGFPVDKRPLRNKEFGNAEGSSIVRPQGGENDILIFDDDGDNCPIK